MRLGSTRIPVQKLLHFLPDSLWEIVRLKIDQQGWFDGLEQAERKPSPNHNDRPNNQPISLLVIHSISLPPGQFGGRFIDDFFLNQLDAGQHPYFKTIIDQKVSSHLLIKRDGQVVQFVSFQKRAWHAGLSCFDGEENCNDFSIGVELEGTDELPYENVQYHRLETIANSLMSAYPEITVDRMVGHSDIAPERKTDPGPGFDWDYFKQLVNRA
jgi:AmpD protein